MNITLAQLEALKNLAKEALMADTYTINDIVDSMQTIFDDIDKANKPKPASPSQAPFGHSRPAPKPEPKKKKGY